MDNYSGAFSAESVKVETLVVHDKNDIDVHISSAHEIVDKLENGKLLVTEGLGHRKILGDPDVINKISTFITE
jgi:pimeloyl-ACP methyl ester carboxylesterase